MKRWCSIKIIIQWLQDNCIVSFFKELWNLWGSGILKRNKLNKNRQKITDKSTKGYSWECEKHTYIKNFNKDVEIIITEMKIHYMLLIAHQIQYRKELENFNTEQFRKHQTET